MIENSKDKIVTKYSATLEEILDYSKAPKIIDYLSLDVEGAETDVFKNLILKNINFYL